MDKSTNAINWFEIPVTDITRARKFYETIFEIQMSDMEMPGMKMSAFPYEPGSGKLSGGIAQSAMHKPSMEGTVVYLNADPEIQVVLDRIEGAGGKVVMPRTVIDENIGVMAFFIDTEGNKVGLHARN